MTIMTIRHFLELFQQYGLFLIVAVCFCEHLNLPGFPAGVIMPAIGVLVEQSALNLPLALALSIAGSVAGSYVLYLISYYGGYPVLHRLFGKSERFQGFVLRCHERIERHRAKGLFLCRLIPMFRTISSIPSGLFRIPARDFLLWSALGITVWNSVLIGFGYLGAGLLLSRI